MKIAVIGAGVAGIACARRCLENGYVCTVYERTNLVGGTWVYDERVGVDEFGLPIHTSMTNLPKELMDFPDFPYEGLDDVSFIKARDVQNYIDKFADHFGLKKYIRFCNLVKSVEKFDNYIWRITSEDLITKKLNIDNYDSVMVCNGHNAVPNMPDIPGNDTFDGVCIHSHDYKFPEKFKNMNVLIVGSGPSGIDICRDVAKVANQVFFSHHNEKLLNNTFSHNVIHKSDIQSINTSNINFVDNTSCTVNAIIYCTGFIISCQFLNSNCGVNVENGKFIYPLHKNIVNINNPTMAFIGFVNKTFIFRVFDLQIRYYLNFLKKYTNLNYNIGMIPVKSHFIGNCLHDYCYSLANEIQIEPIPSIYFEIYNSCQQIRDLYSKTYHSAVFRIIDNTNHVVECNKCNN
ncbi:senecionine N-oxygenase-like isoform X2 [Daktulosphaira vitifoliae]|uniref:senecionine N-oxygenase-like isoform X2 n=1 Tax=Daktulosphaira vitifoliae TaxID=58002 RepID=UPI0021AA55A9|nr:senecionine N-oxygenase-like isoform X2 [Daktulosphaira vitifoliae]